MTERFLLRTTGGPCDGETRIAVGNRWTWPLPDVLKYDASGRYVKIGESGLEPQPGGSRVLRGAEYEWRETP